jgi:hypothetical protein
VSGRSGPVANGSGPDRSQSRFFCNAARQASLLFGLLALAALVVGGGFAEISSNGAPTALETAIVRAVIVGSLAVAAICYVAGGRMVQRGRDS